MTENRATAATPRYLRKPAGMGGPVEGAVRRAPPTLLGGNTLFHLSVSSQHLGRPDTR